VVVGKKHVNLFLNSFFLLQKPLHEALNSTDTHRKQFYLRDRSNYLGLPSLQSIHTEANHLSDRDTNSLGIKKDTALHGKRQKKNATMLEIVL